MVGICKFGAGILKIFIRLFLTLLLSLFGLVFLLQTPIAKKQIKRAIVLKALKHDVSLTIGQIDGSLPFNWIVKDVTASWQGESLSIDTITMRVSVLPLFRKHIDVSHLQFQGGDYKGLPFEGIAKGRLDWSWKKPLKISHFLIEGDDLFLRAEGKVSKKGIVQEGTLAFNIPDLSYFHTEIDKGSLIGTAQITKHFAHFDCLGENLLISSQPCKDLSIAVDAVPKKNLWEGKAVLKGGHHTIPIDANFAFRFKPHGRALCVEEFHINGPQLHCFGKIELDGSLKNIEGTLFAQCRDMKIFRPLLPNSYIKGSIGAKFDFQSYSEFQEFKCQVEVEEFGIYDTSLEAVTIESSIYDLFGELRGEFSVEGVDVSFPQIQLAHLEMKSTFEPHVSPFEFSVRGNWKDPLQLAGNGTWQKRGKGIFIDVDHFKGLAFKKPFSLCEPFSLEWNPDLFKMSNFSMDVATGHVTSRIDLTKTTSLVKIKAEEFPLEFIALPHKHFSLAGVADLDVDLVSWENRIQGNCNIALQRGFFISEGSKQPLMTKGSLQVHLSDSVAQIHGDVKTKNGQFMEVSGSLPITYQPLPFKIQIQKEKPFSGQLVAEGKLEDLFNFINIGHHRIEGWLSTKLHFSKTMVEPDLVGEFELQDGLYENYYTGTFLKQISAKATADKQTIHINDLFAIDGDGGVATGKGDLLLSRTKRFPFSLTAHLDEINTVSFDTITGKFSGDITISGDNQGATAKGNLKVAHAVFRIPDQMPTSLPALPLKFINPPEIVQRRQLPPASSPLQLDLDLEVPRKAYVEGRGINAELKGNLHLTGTYTDIMANGTLQLVKGEYIFSGKVFDLTQGEIIFNDSPTPSSYISLIGNCDLPDVDVTVMLRGPLTTPTLSFQSSPQLSTSSLLSQILFNKDVSEISAVQALQLAQTVISLSGNSAPDILEKIRKSIGIDRLTIVTSENDPGKTSLQIGKYLMRGVMLTLSQGAESRNVSVEVDLKKGIRFQAEVGEDYQRKFSLKWHHHY